MEHVEDNGINGMIHDLAKGVDLDEVKKAVMDGIVKQDQICFGKASQELRALYENKGLGDPAVRSKVVEFLSDARHNGDILVDAQMTLMIVSVSLGNLTFEEFINPKDGEDPLSKVHPEAAAYLADISKMNEAHCDWFAEISSNEDLVNEMSALPRYANGLDFIDYDPNATNPLDRFWIGGQG